MDRLLALAEFSGRRAFRPSEFRACGDPGVYRLYGPDGEVLYVGQSSWVGERLRQHWRRGGWGVVEWDLAIEADESRRLTLEALEVLRWCPTKNRAILLRIARGRVSAMKLRRG